LIEINVEEIIQYMSTGRLQPVEQREEEILEANVFSL
jgi:hypothetical protein